MRQDEQGFTLIELLVTIGLLSIVSVGFYSVMFSTVRGGDTTESVVRTSEEARAGLNRMVRDVREAGRVIHTEENTLGVETDFNDDGIIQSPNLDGDFERLFFQFDAVEEVITIRRALSAPSAILIEGVVPAAGQTGVFSYASNLLEYDWNDDGITTCAELDEAAGRTPPVLGVGNNDGECEEGERPFLSTVDIAFDIVHGDQRTSFFGQAQLRNNR